MPIPYTVSAMPADGNRQRNQFQFKLSPEEFKRWDKVVNDAKLRVKKAQIAAMQKGESVEEISLSDINRALVGMAEAKKGIVTEPERQYFLGLANGDYGSDDNGGKESPPDNPGNKGGLAVFRPTNSGRSAPVVNARTEGEKSKKGERKKK
ncbi:MAG TPA: hypothetical protein VN256_12935 [Pyrinomonadaceae bacterium]|nr:hypothetical protein [Pyrinomonadaceae bacterium]